MTEQKPLNLTVDNFTETRRGVKQVWPTDPGSRAAMKRWHERPVRPLEPEVKSYGLLILFIVMVISLGYAGIVWLMVK